MAVLDDWISGLRRENTRRAYRRCFLQFSGWVGLSPDEMLSKRSVDLRNGDVQENHYFEARLREYMANLEEHGAGLSVMQMSYNSVKSFFDSYGVTLRMRRRDAPKGEYYKPVRPITKSEIRALLAVSDIHERALIMLLKDTGLAVNEVSHLTLQNLQGPSNWRDLLDESRVPIPVVGIRRKTNVHYHTFLGPECVDALRHYFEYREKGTQHLDSKGRGVPAEPLTRNSPVFRCKTMLKPMPSHQITLLVCYTVEKAGLRNVSAHSFRRFFETTLEQPELGIHPAWIKRMMGHKLGVQDRAYSHPTDKQLREAYQQAIPFLSVQPRHVDEMRIRGLEEVVEKEREERERFREENLEMRGQVKELRAQLDHIAESRRETDQIMDRLFQDDEFRALIQRKLKQLS